MAKGTTRVHLLAKELGVKSKAIIEKCQAEGLDIKNHMSTISIGLAATIREWFSEGEHKTTIEKADRVDLEKVRVDKKEDGEDISEDASQSQDTVQIDASLAAVAMDPSEVRLAAQQAAELAAEQQEDSDAEDDQDYDDQFESDDDQQDQEEDFEPEAVDQFDEQDSTESDDDEQSDESEPEPTQEEAESKTKSKPKVKPAPKPEPVVPAGPMLEKPAPAKLSGPKVIRVEKVEEDTRRPRRSRPRPAGQRFDAPISEPLMPQADGASHGKSKRGKKGKDGAGDDDDSRQGKRGKKMRQRDVEDRRARLAAARGESFRSRPSRRVELKKGKDFSDTNHDRPEKATVSEPIVVKDLSAALAVKTTQIITKLMGMGVMASANQTIATDVAEMVAMEFGTELIVELKESLLDEIEKEFDSRERKTLAKRPPVITMLGHVDHGKTSLLDRIRSASVASGEAGGITQHIGAYQVDWKGHKVTFLDTPGHEAFTAMRARGANMTDIVVLVIAADDGVMPQTIEAIHHAKAADVQIIVALNKIDIPGVDVNRVYGQLAEHELTPTEWGGNAEIVKTSAITGQGIDELIEHFEYIAELNDYKADPTIPATGWVIEAKMTSTRGAVATVLIKEGTLNKGDVVLAGNGYGRVRTMSDSKGKALKSAGPSTPVEISGLNGVPQAGDKLYVLEDINRAKTTAEQNVAQHRESSLAQRSQVTLENLFSSIEAGNMKELNLILKADVQGSVDVLIKYLTDLSTEEIKIKILHAAVGGVTEGDVVLAEASNAIVIGFNVVADERVKEIAESKGVDIRFYNIIYRITEDLKDAMVGMLDPEFQEKTLGNLTVRQVFRHSSIGTIAGCYVNSGLVHNKAKLRLIRDSIVIRDNCVIDSLKHFKEDVKEVKSGLECGVKIVGFDDIKVDDVFEAYEVVEIARKL